MRISSNYYNYYNQPYSTNSVQNQNISTDSSDSQQSSVDAVSSATRRNGSSQQSEDVMSLEFSLRSMMHGMKMQNADDSQASDSTNKVQADMDAIKSADIDNMSADDVKSTLSNLITDMQAASNSGDTSNNTSNNTSGINLDNMSDADMKNVLKDIQQRANHKAHRGTDDAFSKVKADMDSIKTADIDSMSDDDVKSTLTNLMTDMSSMRKAQGGYNNNAQQVNLDNMSTTDMRDMLQKIQDRADKEQGQDGSTGTAGSFASVRQDIDSISSADIDNMSSDDMKTSIQNLISDIQAANGSTEAVDDGTGASAIDVNSMTDSQMKDLLMQIQNNANNMPMMDGFNDPQMLNGLFSDQNDTSSVSAS